MNSLISRDLAHNWHPYTQMKDCEDLPPVSMARGRGLMLYDSDGNYYYDTISSWWCSIHGHCHPVLMDALRTQSRRLDHVLFAGFTHVPAVRLSEALARVMPGKNLTRFFYSDNGSTAVETALKMALQYWYNRGYKKKRRFLSLDRGYHGDTAGAMSVSGVSLFTRPFNSMLRHSLKCASPYCYRCPLGKRMPHCAYACARSAEKILRARHKEIAALIVEPVVMAAGGMIVYPPGYLARITRLARKYNVLVIYDEVATGFGRTGTMFACQHAHTAPDFLCLSKGLTSGSLALGVTVTTEDIYRAFYDDYARKKTFYHGHTYTANPLALSVALASLEVFEKEKTMAHVARVAPYFQKKLARFRSLESVGDVRGIGLIGACELVRSKKTKRPFKEQRAQALALYREGLRHHLILRPLGNILYFYLPLIVTRHDIDVIMDTAYAVAGTVLGGHGRAKGGSQ